MIHSGVESGQYSGVILGYGKDLIKKGYERGDDYGDIKIYLPDGIPFQFLRGIEPIGSYERRFLKSLIT